MAQQAIKHEVNPATLGVSEPDDCGPQCLCGSDMTWIDCPSCGGEGETNEYDSDPLWYLSEDEAWEKCEMCAGKGGWWRCLTLPGDGL